MRYMFLKILKSSLVLLSLVSFSLYGQPAHHPLHQHHPPKGEAAECTDLKCNNATHQPPQNRASSPVDETVDKLPILFYSAEKDGKRHYLFGTAHLPIPLSSLYCQAWIERELQASDQVFIEAKLSSFKEYMEREFYLIMQSMGSSFRQEMEWLSLLNKLEYVKQFIIENNFGLRMDSQVEDLAREIQPFQLLRWMVRIISPLSLLSMKIDQNFMN